MESQDFEDFLTTKNDEIDNAAYDLLDTLARATEGKERDTSGKVVAWDMEIIGNLVNYADNLLSKYGYKTCHPYYESEEEMPCIDGTDCDKANCPFKPHGMYTGDAHSDKGKSGVICES